MVIKRDIYLNQLIRKMHNGRIKIITGIRRCGKSFLLSHLFKDYLLSNGIRKDQIIENALDKK
ncbi:MAG: AAA family ATPase [Clostridia bacterium]|nr:AAA family ATPase [Clostridia bacterium]